MNKTAARPKGKSFKKLFIVFLSSEKNLARKAEKRINKIITVIRT
jgi:hypothetical protein